jgi:adenylate cyclase
MWRAGSGPFSMNLRVLLVLSFVGLTVAAAGLVLAVGYGTLSANTQEQLRQRSEVVTFAIVERIRAHLDPIPTVAKQLDGLLAGHGDPGGEAAETQSLLASSLEVAPQISTVAIVEPDLRIHRRFRIPRPGTPPTSDWSDDPEFRRMIAAAHAAGRPGWGPLFYSEAADATYVNYVYPIARSGRTLIFSISIGSLSRFLRQLEHDLSGRVFILRDREFVLAHGDLLEHYPGLSDARPLPSLQEFSDPVLRGIWSEKRLPKLERSFQTELNARVVDVDGRTYVFLFRVLNDYGAVPWQVGTYFTLEALAPQIARNRNLLVGGIVLIAVAALIALLISRLISRPFRQLAASANRIARWQLSSGVDLPSSRIQEIGEANGAFRGMLSALRSFERYVPKPLVRRLVMGESLEDVPTATLPVTVMFTDIIGFTSMAETLQAGQVAALLNEHFTLVDGCIEAAGGTVDKYMGDAVMAFWGGLHADSDQAQHACAAAVRIAASIHADNRRRAEAGRTPIRMRIGIHTGAAVVGNIGAPARINYTVIGDSVNMAARLERLARTVGDDAAEVVIVISGDTAARLGDRFRLRSLGPRILEGRHEETEIYILLAEGQAEVVPPANDIRNAGTAR